MNNQGIYGRTFYGKDIAGSMNIFAETRLDFLDERPAYSHTKVIHVKVASGGGEHVMVMRPSHDERP